MTPSDDSAEPISIPEANAFEYIDLERATEDDILDVSMVSARMLTTGPQRHSLDDVLAQFGYRREQLRDLAE